MADLTLRILEDNTAAIAAAIERHVHDERVKVAYEIEADWKAGVEVKTGTYRRSIHTETDTTPTTSTVGTNLTNPPYPVFREWGTRYAAAHPAATPAFEKARQKYPGLIGGAVSEAIR